MKKYRKLAGLIEKHDELILSVTSLKLNTDDVEIKKQFEKLSLELIKVGGDIVNLIRDDETPDIKHKEGFVITRQHVKDIIGEDGTYSLGTETHNQIMLELNKRKNDDVISSLVMDVTNEVCYKKFGDDQDGI